MSSENVRQLGRESVCNRERERERESEKGQKSLVDGNLRLWPIKEQRDRQQKLFWRPLSVRKDEGKSSNPLFEKQFFNADVKSLKQSLL